MWLKPLLVLATVGAVVNAQVSPQPSFPSYHLEWRRIALSEA